MPQLTSAPPVTTVEPVTEVLHGVTVTDPYRWLEDQDSPRTREWLAEQHVYTRAYLDSIPRRTEIRERVRDLLDVETYDSTQQAGGRYFFRKRKPGQEQPCIYYRDKNGDVDQLLIDPADRGTGPYTSVKPLRVSPNGQLLLYEVKEGGERTGTFEILEVAARKTLPDILPRGYLRGFVFSSDSKSFYYSHEPLSAKRPHYRSVNAHVVGTDFSQDREIFFAGEEANLRLGLVSDSQRLGILVYRFADTTSTDFFLGDAHLKSQPTPIVQKAPFKFAPFLLNNGRILAITNLHAPNFRIVELNCQESEEAEFLELIPETEWPIQEWAVAGEQILVSYFRNLKSEIEIFSLAGKPLGLIPIDTNHTVRLIGNNHEADEVLFEQESFTMPIQICSYTPTPGKLEPLVRKIIPFDSDRFRCAQVWFTAKDGTQIPMSVVGSNDVLDRRSVPTIMTSYGGYQMFKTGTGKRSLSFSDAMLVQFVVWRFAYCVMPPKPMTCSRIFFWLCPKNQPHSMGQRDQRVFGSCKWRTGGPFRDGAI